MDKLDEIAIPIILIGVTLTLVSSTIYHFYNGTLPIFAIVFIFGLILFTGGTVLIIMKALLNYMKEKFHL